MILDELVLHHFGVYGPRQVVELAPPSPERPVVLFGGLNGGGKTTLLDAVQLCLFGPQARCSNRGGLAYHDYLLRSIHRRAAVEEAAVELAFRHTVDGAEERFRLHRSWRRAAGGCRERFEVVRDGRLDRALTENWAQQVDDLFPARIAHLFLFDGEKVEAYAAPESSSALVGAAIHDLLGLDVVDRLDRDLRVLERRKRAEAGSSDAAPATAESERELRDLRQRLDQLKQEQAGVRGRIERKRRALADAEERFRGLGGELLERREALERRRDEADAAVGGAERRLRELAAGPLPFLLVPDLLEAVRARDGAERETLQARAVADAPEARDRALLDELPGLGAGRAVGEAVGAFLADDLRRRREAAGQPVHLELPAEARHRLAALLGG